jgi:hypothetical protein
VVQRSYILVGLPRSNGSAPAAESATLRLIIAWSEDKVQSKPDDPGTGIRPEKPSRL